MTWGGFLLACAAIGIPALFLCYLEYRSRPRDSKSQGLAAANKLKVRR